MAANNGVWGIDIGQTGLKALKLRLAENDQVEVVAFDLIEHPKLLSQPDAEPEELIKAALEKFVSRNDWQRDQFVIGVPGQQTFARFCKLPPVDAKKIPDIVRFEASQQIPFEMDDVVWDYHVFQAKDSPDVEVGIFAMRKDLVRKQLDYFSGLGVAPVAIQTIPSALYNFCRFDGLGAVEDGKATVVVDVGAQNTDLVIVEKNSAWNRNIPLGGNNFTEALVKGFKLSFAKAESLKRSAATSKYARQIFQAMRPVFADLVAEIQRSLGFYSSTHREVELTTVLACGNAFRLPGLQKYLENNLTLGGGVIKLEKFNKVAASATVNAPQFTDNVLSFGAAYGLALQGLGVSTISANLLPPELARIAMWRKKTPYFMATAACLALAAGFPWLRNNLDQAALAGGTDAGNQAKAIVDRARNYQSEFSKVQGDAGSKKEQIDKLFELQKNRALVPRLVSLVHEALPEIDPALLAADTADKLKKLVSTNPGRYARQNRRQILVDSFDVRFSKNIDAMDQPQGLMTTNTQSSGGGGFGMPSGGGRFGVEGGGPGRVMGAFGGGGGGGGEMSSGDGEAAAAPGFYVQFNGRLTYGATLGDALRFVQEEFYPELRRKLNQPGTGFYIPDTDEKNVADPQKRNLRPPALVRDPAAAQQQQPQPGMPGRSAGQPGGEEAPVVLDPDPLTGEERINDWKFTIAFKVKLGEAPPAPEQAPTGG